MRIKDLFSRKDESPVDSKYPKWEQVKSDPSYLPDRMLMELQKVMVFIVDEKGKEHAAVAVRAEKSEFQTPVTDSTPIRLYVGFYSGRNGDIFSIYPLVLDNPHEPAFKETWIKPYEDDEGVEQSDPLSAEARKRLRLLLNQTYTQMIFINNQDQIIFTRQVPFTSNQQKLFKLYSKRLEELQGKHLPKTQYFSLIQEYMNSVPMGKLLGEFLALFK